MEKNLGGDRLGTGAKIKVDLHNWGRSTFNQSRIWRSTMGVGALTPCFVEIGTNGTTFDIDINTLGHTIPTIAPLFGSYKLQVDLFACPIRLYQGLLHNNAVNIGLEMNKVLFPNITLGENNEKTGATNPSSLLNYLGIKGYTNEKKTFNALPILAYYDIFKNYYSNKQEENAKIIGNIRNYINLSNIQIGKANNSEEVGNFEASVLSNTENYTENQRRQYNQNKQRYNLIASANFTKSFVNNENTIVLTNNQQWESASKITIKAKEIKKIENIEISANNQGSNITIVIDPQYETNKSQGLYINTNFRYIGKWYIEDENQITLINELNNNMTILSIKIKTYKNELNVYDFPLENIDRARRAILGKSNKNQRIHLNEDLNFLPYNINFENDNEPTANKEMNGLLLKTYLSDIYNNWLSIDYVDLINEISSIAPNENGTISMDSLILAKKVYNVLNRIAVSGGTYEDWQESVYGENALKRAESPIYLGGTSSEIVFEEVVSTATTEGEPLGSLGGRGQMTNKKGGKILYKCEEPTIIIGIASITPRLDYYQGNKWYMTDLDNMDNLHKPGLDGIGFQNLIANNVVWSDSPEKALAKQTAWINYQTAVNEVFGYFALGEKDDNSLHFMTLRRDFETDSNGEIIDFTTYIDPQKFNKVFASEELTAQNFWIQIGFNVKSRRKMAAYEIPNL